MDSLSRHTGCGAAAAVEKLARDPWPIYRATSRNISPLCAFAHRCGDVRWHLRATRMGSNQPDVQEPLHLRRLHRSPQDSRDFDVACCLRIVSMRRPRRRDQRGDPARPVGFAEIVAKVKPAVIAVTVRLESDAQMESDEPDAPSRSQPFSENSPLHRHFFGSPQRQSSPGTADQNGLGIRLFCFL